MSRWQLARAGILNVYQYENEILEFRGGRLLLRGINGSGKSTAMNMLLPFLLTGRTRGIDAAGEQTGVLKSWMLSGRDEAQPVGYLWVEFTRQAQKSAETSAELPGSDATDGAREGATSADNHLVIGCGIKANRASDTVTTWWFVTRRRPGVDLQLIEQGIPLSVDGLRAVIDPDPVFTQDRRADYRREVSRRLYGGADNDTWLSLLDTVRNPRVGDRVDLDLPEHLTGALPTLSETALIEAARPLDDLDEHRRNVADLVKTDATLRAIGEVYRNYALGELHREAADARAVSRRAEEKLRVERRSVEADDAATLAAEEASEQLTELSASLRTLDDEIAALKASFAYTEGQQLDDLRTAVADLHRRLTRERSDFERELIGWRSDAVNVSQRQRRYEEDQRALQSDLTGIATSIDAHALGVRLPAQAPVPARAMASCGEEIAAPSRAFASADLETALGEAAAATLNRRADIDVLRALNVALAALSVDLQSARAHRESCEGLVGEADSLLIEARESLAAEQAAWDERILHWVDDVDACLTTSEEAHDTAAAMRWRALADADVRIDREGRRTSFDAFALQWQDVRQRVQLQTEADQRFAEDTETAARTELDDLMAQRQPVLPRPDWQRDPGLTFADVVEFRSHVDARTRARLEAALQASGLLSATIGRQSVTLATGDLLAVAATPVVTSLADLLEPIALTDAPANLERAAVTELLAAISTDLTSEAAMVITATGEFRLGGLVGRNDKEVAEHVGIGARRAALERQRALARAALVEATSHRDAADEARRLADAALQVCVAYRQSLPPLNDVQAADARLQAAGRQRLRACERAQVASELEAEVDRRHAGALDERDRQARSLRLPVDAAALQRVDTDLDNLKRDVRDVARSIGSVSRSVVEWQQAADRWQVTGNRLDARRDQLDEDTAHHDGQRVRLDTLEATLGTAYRDVVATIDARVETLVAARRTLPAVETERTRAIGAKSDAQASLRLAIEARITAETECERRHARLCTVLDVPGLVDIVDSRTSGSIGEGKGDEIHTDASSGATEDVEDGNFASRLRTTLAAHPADRPGLVAVVDFLEASLPVRADGVTTSADGVRQSMMRRRDALGAGWDAENHQPDPNVPMALSVNGPLARSSLAEALVHVGAERRKMQSLLSEKQDQALRTLLHGQLASDVARKLQQAKTLVARMNNRLGSVTTSHGIGVRLRWRRDPELEATTTRMVDILEKLPDLRSEDEEVQLREALSTRLDEARRLEPEAPYRQLIDTVLDYRRWHEMRVLLRRGNDNERPLTRRTPLSEGEKKLVTYLPLFSAVAAACDALEEAASHSAGQSSGSTGVPRFLLLDDAFAKVSEDNHARLFGLLVELDLDFIATSERLWGTHATVPELAITEVVRDDVAGVILLEHSRWDGTTLTMAP